MPLSSFAPLSGILQGLNQAQNYQYNQIALQNALQQQQVLSGLWPSLQQYPGAGLQPQTQPPPIQPSQLTAPPQQPQAPAPTGGGMPQAPSFQLPQVPSFGATPFGQPQPLPTAGGGMPSTLPGLDGTTYGVGGALGPSGLGMPSALSGLQQQGFGGTPTGLPQMPSIGGQGGPSTFPGFDGTTLGAGLPQPGAQVAPSGGTAPSSGTAGVSPLSPFVDPNSPYGQAVQAGSGAPYSQQPLPQPGTSAQQPQAPGPVGDPGTPQPPPQTGGAAGLFQSTILPIESGGDINIPPGSYGEIGPAQILPETFRQYAVGGEDIYNPRDNLRVGQRYAEDLWQKSGGDAAATLVGYNRGEGAMRRFQAAGDDPRSVKLAPAYQQAVARQQGQQAYAESSAHINASTSPQEKAHADAGARNILAQMPNPLAFAGRIEIPQLVQAIDRGNPNASDAVKSGIFMKLYPMLSQADQQQYTRLWDQYKEAQTERRFDITKEQQERDFQQRQRDLEAQRDFNRQLATGKLAQGAEAGSVPFQPTDEQGKPVGPPGMMSRGGVFTPGSNLPAGATGGTRVGTPPRSAAGTVSRAQAEWVATYVEKTGTWPTTSGRNLALTNQVEQILAERGVDPTKVAEAMGTFGATKSSLTAATKLRDVVHGYEGTALRNLDQATKEMHKTAPTNFGPWLNNWMLTGSMQMGGTGPPAEIAAVLTFANEYAKVMSGATGAAAATEGARREAAELFSPYFSAGQWDEAARIAKTDMGNRMRELDDNVDVITSRLGRGAPEKSARPPAAKEAATYNSPDDIYRAVDAGTLSADEAKKLLVEKFGFTPAGQ